MTFYALLFALASIGVSITAYLINTRAKQEQPVCVIGKDCHVVLESKYNSVLGIHNEVFGLIYFTIIALLCSFIVIGIGNLQWWTMIITIFVSSAAVLSLGLIILQWKIIKSWCFWCVMSALVIFCMEIAVLTHAFILHV
ncbi:MAG: hypothetical protein COU35_04950 [Candidatus Magasanikbacteria bacterium CG10_big_fil_rev_8_21_14_0_10_47_10]|uniref:Vitamin K epoxide reductase domain-containing protein n=1 Tax=Candidatus Magasanikbacteria bacterium CG10_big_fil_rev_8_21_14_0_10_47_10 TaxID=1974652 RepID=A0A2H0TP93_9BACT|nr:MAG: hypothetical protein COU35_04950 [Candidatus Magasanikbacteria bacterium CG10_big_fil_rev_8_21_14_0_10_47_10]